MDYFDWSNIRDEYPQMPEDIKKMIEEETRLQIEGRGYKKKYRLAKIAGAAATALALTGGTCYAIARINAIKVEKVGNYGADISVVTDNNGATDIKADEAVNAVASDKDIPEIAMEIKELPDDYVTMGGYQDTDQDGISFNSAKILIRHKDYDSSRESAALYVYSFKDGYENFVSKEENVMVAEELNLGKGIATYIEYHAVNSATMDITSKIYIVYPEYNHMIEICGFNNMSKEDMCGIAAAIDVSLAEEKEENFYTYSLMLEEGDLPFYTYSENDVNDADISSYEDRVSKYSVVDKASFDERLHKCGDEVRFSCEGKYSYLYEKPQGDFGVRITDVQVLDNVDMLEESRYCQSVDNNVGADGKLIPENLQYVKYGDGINSVDEVVKTETKNMKFVYITMQYTNYSGGNNVDLCYNPGIIIRAKEENGMLRAYTRDDYKEDGIDAVTGEFYHDTFLSDYWYNGVDTNQNNHLVDFSEGETRTVYSGFFVAEDELSDMYLNLFPAYETNEVFDHFEESDDRNGYFDIRQ